MRSRSGIALVSVAVVGLLALAVPVGAQPNPDDHLAVAGHSCRQIGFEPNTDNVAAAIQARNMRCHKVRRAIRRFHARGIDPAGFSCRSREHYLVLNHTDYRCVDGERRFSWEKY